MVFQASAYTFQTVRRAQRSTVHVLRDHNLGIRCKNILNFHTLIYHKKTTLKNIEILLSEKGKLYKAKVEKKDSL